MKQIEYKLTGESIRGDITPYHYKAPPLDHSVGAGDYDLSGMSRPLKRKLIMDGASRFRIGFEIEKVALDRDALREYELFCGFERDSSCGYEAVTNVLPLLPPSVWRDKVFDLMLKANRIIDDKFSPSDVRCGGHINVSVIGMGGYEVLKHIRKHMGVLYALYRFRLINKMCRGDIFMSPWSPKGLETDGARYNVARVVSGEYVEIRIPNRVVSVRQLILRYELMYELMYASFEGGGYSFLRKVRPIVSKMYDDDKERVDEVMRLATHFQRMIDSSQINEYVRQFVDPQGEMVAYYDDETKQQFLHRYEENNEDVHPF